MTDTLAGADAARLDAPIRAFLRAPHFATLASIGPDGWPRAVVVWYRLDADDRIVVNSRDGRRWPADLRRDGRVFVAVTDRDDGRRWVGVRGLVETVIDDQATAQADIAGLARRYHPREPAVVATDVARFRTETRVSFRIRPVAVHPHLD